jgi:hypothetical protein
MGRQGHDHVQAQQLRDCALDGTSCSWPLNVEAAIGATLIDAGLEHPMRCDGSLAMKDGLHARLTIEKKPRVDAPKCEEFQSPLVITNLPPPRLGESSHKCKGSS